MSPDVCLDVAILTGCLLTAAVFCSEIRFSRLHTSRIDYLGCLGVCVCVLQRAFFWDHYASVVRLALGGAVSLVVRERYGRNR